MLPILLGYFRFYILQLNTYKESIEIIASIQGYVNSLHRFSWKNTTVKNTVPLSIAK